MEATPQTLTGQFAVVFREAADAVALNYREGDTIREYSYGQLYRRSLVVAGWLQAQGVERGSGWPFSWRTGPSGP